MFDTFRFIHLECSAYYLEVHRCCASAEGEVTGLKLKDDSLEYDVAAEHFAVRNASHRTVMSYPSFLLITFRSAADTT